MVLIWNLKQTVHIQFKIHKKKTQQKAWPTLSRLILLNGNHFPTKTTTGRPNLSTPLW